MPRDAQSPRPYAGTEERILWLLTEKGQEEPSANLALLMVRRSFLEYVLRPDGEFVNNSATSYFS